MVVPAPGSDLVGSFDDRVCHVLVEHAKLGIHVGGRRFDPRQSLDMGALEPQAGYREVLHCALCLRPPSGGCWNPYLTHRIVLDAVCLIGTFRLAGTAGGLGHRFTPLIRRLDRGGWTRLVTAHAATRPKPRGGGLGRWQTVCRPGPTRRTAASR